MVTPGRLPVLVGERSSWPLAIALASAVLAMPLMATGPGARFRGLDYPTLEFLALGGLIFGWLVADRVAALGRSTWFLAGMVALIPLVGYHLATTQAADADIVALGVSAGALIRGRRPWSRDPAAVVALAAMASWIVYDVPTVLHRPMRDLHTYLSAARDALTGGSAYLQGPLTSLPDADQYPFVYPPFTLPLFETLAQLPLPLVELGWLLLSGAAVLGALWLLGVRGRWLVALVAWPAFAVGLSVGNVAAFGFLCLALGFRFAAALVIGGLFKAQAGVPAIWALRERRIREVAVGAAVLAGLAIASIPLIGLAEWGAWLRGLAYFEASLEEYRWHGASLTGSLPVALVVVMTIAAVGAALLRGGRNGLARAGLASIVASPTLYIHGFAPVLPGALALRPELFWFVAGIVAWDAWLLPISGGWVALAIVGLALLRATGTHLASPVLSHAAADVHPAGSEGEIWPAPTRSHEVVAMRAATPDARRQRC